MRLWVKIFLFFSSYLPLFYILTIKNWFNSILLAVSLTLTIFSFIAWYGLHWLAKDNTLQRFKVIHVEDKLKESLTYLIPYIVSFLELDLNKWQDWVSLSVLMFVIFLVYVNTKLIFVNPILLIFHYRIYYVKLRDPITSIETTCMLLTKRRKKLRVDEEIFIKNLDEEIYEEEQINGVNRFTRETKQSNWE